MSVIYNREDSRTALPQLEKQLAELTSYREYHPTFHQCTNGAYTQCYRIGSMVMLSFNINITTATSGYAYLENIPRAVGNFACCAVGDSGSANITRFYVTPNGTLCADGTPATGWLNGSVVYITKETT